MPLLSFWSSRTSVVHANPFHLFIILVDRFAFSFLWCTKCVNYNNALPVTVTYFVQPALFSKLNVTLSWSNSISFSSLDWEGERIWKRKALKRKFGRKAFGRIKEKIFLFNDYKREKVIKHGTVQNNDILAKIWHRVIIILLLLT